MSRSIACEPLLCASALTRAVQLDRRQAQLLRDVLVLDGVCLVDGFALDPLGGERRRGNGRATAECFELRVDDLAVLVDFDLRVDR